jgi:riboflavin synthase
MFTGIIEEVGAVESLREAEGGWRLDLNASIADGAAPGQSIAVNGACLTVTAVEAGRLSFGLARETLARTNLGDLKRGDPVNLERALRADGRLDGHIVQGHVDGTGRIEAMTADGDSLRCTVSAPPELMRYIVAKGFIAVDGASLTVIDVAAEGFTFMLVAYTQRRIALPRRPPGSRVNLEVDLLAKYVERMLRVHARSKRNKG